MEYTENDLAVRVLRDLGLVGGDETPSAADHAWAKQTNASEIALLARVGLPIWNGSVMSIPEEYFTTLSRRLGIAIEPSFGRTSLAEAQNAMREAERYLTLMAAPRSRPATLDAREPSFGGMRTLRL